MKRHVYLIVGSKFTSLSDLLISAEENQGSDLQPTTVESSQVQEAAQDDKIFNYYILPRRRGRTPPRS